MESRPGAGYADHPSADTGLGLNLFWNQASHQPGKNVDIFVEAAQPVVKMVDTLFSGWRRGSNGDWASIHSYEYTPARRLRQGFCSEFGTEWYEFDKTIQYYSNSAEFRGLGRVYPSQISSLPGDPKQA